MTVKVGKQSTKQEQLQNLLNKQAAALSHEALQSEGNVQESKLQELERLARLVALQKSLKPSPPRFRWPIVALLVITLMIVSVLLFARVSSTEIELDLSLSELSFRLPQQQVLTEEMRLSSLGISGIQQIEIPRSQTTEAQTVQSTDGSGTAIQLKPEVAEQATGSVTLGALILPARAHVEISPADIAGQYRLSIKDATTELNAGVQGAIEMGQPGAPPQLVNFTSPKSFLLQTGLNDVDVDISLLAGAKNPFSRQLLADSLSLFSIDRHADAKQTIVRRISSILSGTIYFESLGGKEQKLRSGQEIRFESSVGEIRTLELKDDYIAFAFHCSVRGMTSGNEDNRTSLMPTYLEWLSARHGLSLLWGTTLYFFGIIVSILSWWRAKP